MMNMIENIFIDFMENNEVVDSAKIKKTNEIVLNYLESVAKIKKDDVDDMLSVLGYEYEKQGFINGFAYALHLTKEGALL